jgi:hypothetical protein
MKRKNQKAKVAKVSEGVPTSLRNYPFFYISLNTFPTLSTFAKTVAFTNLRSHVTHKRRSEGGEDTTVPVACGVTNLNGFMRNTPNKNGNGDNGPPEVSADIYLCQPARPDEPVACTACGNSFGEPWIRFFMAGDVNFPVCKKCALK